MHPQFTSAMSEQRRRQFVADASHARLVATARAATPRLRKQSKRLSGTSRKPRFAFRTARPLATA